MSDINEALYQLKQRIMMHEIGGTTSNQNEREKVLLNYINKQKEVLDKIKEIVKKDRIYITGERNLSHEIEELLEEIE